MNSKPTYEELQQRIEELEEVVVKHKWAKAALSENQKRYRYLVENVNDIIWEVDVHGRYTFLSPRVHYILGYETEELLGRSFTDIMLPDEADRLFDFFMELVSEPESFTSLESEVIHKEGYPVILENSANPFFDTEGNLLGFRGVNRDITARKRAEDELRKYRDNLEDLVAERTYELRNTNDELQKEIIERKHAEKALRESQERYRRVVEDQTELICRSSRNGDLNYVNDAYCRYFGKRREELIGQSFLPFMPEDDGERVKNHLAGINQTNPVDTIEHRVVVGEGIRWLQWTNRAIFNTNGEFTEFQSVGRDVTGRKQAEVERERLIDELQNALDNIKTLKGLLPICASCKKIRDDKGYWNKLEGYIESHSDVSFSHGLCPECMDKLYGEQEWYKKMLEYQQER